MTGDYCSPPHLARATTDDRREGRPNPLPRTAATPVAEDNFGGWIRCPIAFGHVEQQTGTFGPNIPRSGHDGPPDATNDYHPVSDFDVARNFVDRGRGLEKRVALVYRPIEIRLAAKRHKVRLLEIGCGYGVALMQLRHRFGGRVDLFGTNRETAHGDIQTMISASLMQNASTAAEIKSVRLPTINYCDVSNGLPFDDRTFELVVSQMCIQLVPDKLRLLGEAARVLAEDGIATIHTPLHDPSLPTSYASLLETWDKVASLTFCDYLARWEGVTALQLGSHSCVHSSHREDFVADLELLYAIRLTDVFPAGRGIKSIYRRKH